MNVAEEVIDLLKGRLAEIDQERKQLQKSLSALEGDSPAVRSPRRQPRPKNGSKARAPRGQRREEVLTQLEKNPGARPSDVAKVIGVSGNQIHGLISKLRKERLVKKQGKGYALTSTAQAASKGS